MDKGTEIRTSSLPDFGAIGSLAVVVATIIVLGTTSVDPRVSTLAPEAESFYIFSDPPGATVYRSNNQSNDHEMGVANETLFRMGDFRLPEEKSFEVELKFKKDGFKDVTKTIKEDQIVDGKWPPANEDVIKLGVANPAAYLSYVVRYHPFASGFLLLGLVGLGVSVALSVNERRKRRVLLRYEADPGKDPYVGRVLQGHFVAERLGKGAAGAVYRVLPEKSLDEKRSRALKIVNYDDYDLKDEHSREMYEQAKERFMREMEMLATSQHENIYQIYDFGREEGYDWVIMPCYSQSLEYFVEKEKPSPEKVLSIAKQLAAGLQYAHDQGVGHRDLKPDNIMFDGETLKIIDFGLAKVRDKKTITHMGTIMGTPKYMAPEQTTLQVTSDYSRTDQFTYGLILFQLVTGEHAYPDPEDPIQTIVYRQTGRPARLRDVAPQHSEELEAVFEKMFAANPADRYLCMLDASAAFEQAFKESAQVASKA